MLTKEQFNAAKLIVAVRGKEEYFVLGIYALAEGSYEQYTKVVKAMEVQTANAKDEVVCVVDVSHHIYNKISQSMIIDATDGAEVSSDCLDEDVL
jgi:hypothetical protein